MNPDSVNVHRAFGDQRPGVLYVTYDGLLEPIGESQVVNYVDRLSAWYRFTIISFEKPSDLADSSRVERMRQSLAEKKVDWVILRYHKAPSLPATAFDTAIGVLVAMRVCITKKIRLIHCRSYVPAAIGLCLNLLLRRKWVFDIRGLWVDERVDAGLWKANSLLYRAAKMVERMLFRRAGKIVSLTQNGVEALEEAGLIDASRGRDVVVIPTCVDLSQFKLGNGPEREFTLGYSGSVAGWYRLAPVLECFKVICEYEENAKLLVVNRDNHSLIAAQIRASGVESTRIRVTSASFEQMPGIVAGFSASAFFIQPTFSKRASAPTKLAELLAAGVPCLTNGGVGDTAAILDRYGVGVVVADTQPETLRLAVGRLLELTRQPGIRERCRRAADLFSLERGVEGYRSTYAALLGTDPDRASAKTLAMRGT